MPVGQLEEGAEGRVGGEAGLQEGAVGVGEGELVALLGELEEGVVEDGGADFEDGGVEEGLLGGDGAGSGKEEGGGGRLFGGGDGGELGGGEREKGGDVERDAVVGHLDAGPEGVGVEGEAEGRELVPSHRSFYVGREFCSRERISSRSSTTARAASFLVLKYLMYCFLFLTAFATQ